MKFSSVVLESYASYLPEEIVSSEELEERLRPCYERIGLIPGRLKMMTGIEKRGLWPVGTRPSDLAARAGRENLERSQFHPSQIDLLINASVCRDQLEPATAMRVHSLLGLSSQIQAFDLSNACLGFLNAMVVAAQYIERGAARAVQIIAGENAGPLIEETVKFLNGKKDLTRKSIKPYFANLTIGSGAASLIMTHKSLSPNSPSLLGGASGVDSDAHELCQGGGTTEGLMMQTESEDLLHRGLTLSKKVWDQTLKNLGRKAEAIDHFLPHQVGRAHTELLFKRLGITGGQAHSNFAFLGNTGPCAVPLTLFQGGEEDKFSKGQLLALLGIGSGLSSVMLGVRW